LSKVGSLALLSNGSFESGGGRLLISENNGDLEKFPLPTKGVKIMAADESKERVVNFTDFVKTFEVESDHLDHDLENSEYYQSRTEPKEEMRLRIKKLMDQV
jgi:hypothetical protein